MPQHGLGGQADLTEQALRATAREIKHRLGVCTGGLRIANDGHVIAVFDVEQGTRRFIGQTRRHFFIHKMHHLCFEWRRTKAGRRLLGLLLGQDLQSLVGPTLGLHGHTGDLMP